MNSSTARTGKALRLALIISIALHGAVLLLRLSQPQAHSGPAAASVPKGPLNAVLTKPSPPRPRENTSPKKAASSKASRPILSAPGGPPVSRPQWTQTERDDMNAFLNELSAPPPRPATGRELAQQGRAMARAMGREHEADEDTPRAGSNRPVDAFTMEMYFEAFVRKMNSSAAFVERTPRGGGRRKALVQITLNADGSLKSYQVLRAADQQQEIAFIKNVVERAAPFSAFPPAMRDAAKLLTVLMCITATGNGSDGFVRISGSNECRD